MARSARRIPPLVSAGHADAIIESSLDAILSKDRDGIITSWNLGAERLYGYSPDEAVGQPVGILIPPHRAGEERRILDRILTGERVQHYETERVRKDGGEVVVSLTVSPIHEPDGEISGASVIARDVTERRRADQRAEELLRITAALSRELSSERAAEILVDEAMPVFGADAATLGVLDEAGERIQLVAASGYSDAIDPWTTFPLSSDVPMAAAIRDGETIWSNSPEELKADFPELAETEFRFDSLAVVPLTVEGRTFGAVALSFSERRAFTPQERAFMITTAQQAANALDRARQHEGERRAREQLAFISRASEVLGESLDLEVTLQRLASLAVPHVADWCAVDLAADGGIRSVAVAHADPDKLRIAAELRERYPPNPDDPGGVPNVLRSGQAELYSRVSDDLLVEGARDDDHLRMMRELGLISAMVVPLNARGRTMGAITFVAAESGRRYGESDLAFAQELAGHAALAIDTSKRYGDEHEAAITLQRALLPRSIPELPRVDVAVRYFPAGPGVEAGGDWYDVIDLGDERIGVVIGDVSGRGIAAAAIMGRLRTAIRAYAIEGHDPAGVAQRTSRLMQELEERDMATLMILRLDTATGDGEFVRAGHLPGLVRAQDGSVSRLYGEGSPPLGTFPDVEMRGERFRLEPGSVVLLYTDGLIERRDTPIDETVEELERAFAQAPDDLEGCLDHVIDRVQPDAAFDDIAAVAMRLRG